MNRKDEIKDIHKRATRLPWPVMAKFATESPKLGKGINLQYFNGEKWVGSDKEGTLHEVGLNELHFLHTLEEWLSELEEG